MDSKFVFPAEEQKGLLDRFCTKRELVETIKDLLRKSHPEMPFSYQVYSKPEQENRLFCYCRSCTKPRAKLIYQFRENSWNLTNYEDKHNHETVKPKDRMKEKKVEEIKEFIEDLRAKVERKALVSTVRKHFQAPKSTVYKLYHQVVLNEKIPFDVLFQELDPNYDISYSPIPLGEHPLPVMLLISNQGMR